MMWALEVVHQRASAGDFEPPIHAILVGHITSAASALSRIYAQEYQVLPYIYTHLVSLACAVYLVTVAFLKGLFFEPSSTFVFGLLLPLTSITLTAMTVLGLLEIGALLANPLGPHRESFAVCHFVNCARSPAFAGCAI